MAQDFGYNANLFVKPEATYGTAPSGNWVKVPFISADLGAEREQLEDDQIIGQGPEQTDPEIDVKDVKGRIEVPLDVRGFGWWLRTAFNVPTTTGAGPYVHTFKSNSATLASLAAEFQRAGVTKFNLHTGIVVETLEFGAQRAGWANCTLQLIGQNEVRGGTTGAGTPTAPAVIRFVNRSAAIKKDGAALAKVINCRLSFENGPEIVPGIRSDGLIEAVDQGLRRATGTMDVRFDSMTLLDAADAKTAMAIELSWTSGAHSLVVTMPRVFLKPTRPPIAGRGGVQVSYAFRAAKDATELCMVKSVLTNDVASYA